MAGNGFFGWIRDGVRQSVLLGFSDAVTQLGSPCAAGELHPDFAALLRSAPNEGAADSAPFAPRSERKRLGRSLQQIQPRAAADARAIQRAGGNLSAPDSGDVVAGG